MSPLFLEHSCVVPLATGSFGERATASVAVTLRWLLRADGVQWFPGNAVERGHQNATESVEKANRNLCFEAAGKTKMFLNDAIIN